MAAPQAGSDPGTLVDDVTEALMPLIQRRRPAIRIARNAAVVIGYLLESRSGVEGYAVCTKRRGAKVLRLSVSELRTTLRILLHWRWIERQSGGPTSSGHYRLTNEFVEVVRQEDSALYTAIHEDLHVEEAYGLTGPEACTTINGDLREALHALTYAQWMHRLFELNRLRRDRYRRAYHKVTLRNICKVLHWLLQQDARHPDVWIITSLRRLAAETGLVFETAKQARDHLVRWGVLEHTADGYRLRHQRLVDIIEGEDAELPAPTQRVHRKAQDSSRTRNGSSEASASECCGLPKRGPS